MAIGVVLQTMAALDLLVQWGAGWRYLLSPTFRRAVHSQWRSRPRSRAIGEAAFMFGCFVLLNGAIAVILYVVFVGPIRPIHEW